MATKFCNNYDKTIQKRYRETIKTDEHLLKMIVFE